SHYMMAASPQAEFNADVDLDAQIAQARDEMERAAKSLDFLAAARFRDRMYELQKQREEQKK
ncbi:MAG: UvrB/UvrC motif-containing protein, partial [Alistipes sp.]|nr:UvrB/UvrC motif-containing protein [Alistipes sp.]